nr:RNA-directed DNA polymerase, eukaryota, reverse transcriptase zinc-binding domain protein [Tanacetum cinerariifolium]
MNPGVPPKSKPSKPAFNFSFKDTVAGSNRDNRVKISIEEDGFTRSKLDCCWTRKRKTNVGSINGSDDIKPWEETGELHGRLTWMVIEGIPILGRNIATLKAIAGRFDGLLEVGRLNFDSKIITLVKALIPTYNMREVGQLIDVVLNIKSDPVGYLRNPLCCLVSSTTIKVFGMINRRRVRCLKMKLLVLPWRLTMVVVHYPAKRIQEYRNTKSPFLVIGDIVSQEQSAFIKGRQIMDGPLILNEVISWCKARKDQILLFKVDFQKAFDSVRWDHLDDILGKFDFGNKVGGFVAVFTLLKLRFWSMPLWHGVCLANVQHMAESFGCLGNNLPFTYLGVKVGANMMRLKSWSEVEKFKRLFNLELLKDASVASKFQIPNVVSTFRRPPRSGGAWERVDGALEYMPLNCVKRTLILPLLSSYSCLLEAVSERLDIDASSGFMLTYNSDNDIVEVCDDLKVNAFVEFVVKSSRIVTLCIVESSVYGTQLSNTGNSQQSNFVHAIPSVNVFQTKYHATQTHQTQMPVFPGSGFYQNLHGYQQMHGFLENPMYVPGFSG